MQSQLKVRMMREMNTRIFWILVLVLILPVFFVSPVLCLSLLVNFMLNSDSFVASVIVWNLSVVLIHEVSFPICIRTNVIISRRRFNLMLLKK